MEEEAGTAAAAAVAEAEVLMLVMMIMESAHGRDKGVTLAVAISKNLVGPEGFEPPTKGL